MDYAKVSPITSTEVHWILSHLTKAGQGEPTDISATLHPNGFKCVLLDNRSRSAEQIRLHLWPASAEDADVHDHAWDFRSLCIYGSIVLENYGRRSGNSFSHYVCRGAPVVGGTKNVTLEYVGPAGLEIDSVSSCKTGQQYFLDSNVLHKASTNASSPIAAITLVKRGPYKRNFTNVYLSQEWKDRGQSIDRSNKIVPYGLEQQDREFCIEQLERIVASIT